MRRVRVPADVDREDRVLGNLTARQVAILAAAALLLWAGHRLAGTLLPVPALLALALPVATLATALALGRWDGLPGDRFALAALRHLLQPARRAAAPEGLPQVPGPLAAIAPALAPLGLPVHGIDSSGIVDLGGLGSALLVRASSVGFSLRADAEQEALVAAFGRFLNALSAPVQIAVRAERVDLRDTAAGLERAAAGLPHPLIEAAAREHAAFLRALSDRRDLFHREALVVFRDAAPPAAAAELLRRRVEEAAALLRGTGISLRPLDGAQALRTLLRAADPEALPPPADPALPGEPTCGRS